MIAHSVEHEYKKIQASSLRCARTGRELKPGEKYFSVLYDREGALVREDVSQDAWTGPPEEAFSFWMGHVPAKDQSRRVVVDDDLLLDCFLRLNEETEPRKVNFRYILALLLMRRKQLKFEDAKVENGQEFLLLRCTKTRTLYSVVNPQLTDEQLTEVQEEVQRIFDL